MEANPEIKILLVDDREDNLFSMEELLTRNDYHFRKARSGNEALKILLKEFDFTLIIMDVQMPGLNGIETAAMIYQSDKLRHIPIIFITGGEYNATMSFKGYKTGGVDYIYKPINPDLLRAKVSVFVDLYRKNHLLMDHEKKLNELNQELEGRVERRTKALTMKNEELEITNAELKRVNNDLDSFVYTASHDLKAPISNIEGLVNMLKRILSVEKSKNEVLINIFNMIEQSIARFKSTVQDLADIVRVNKIEKEEEVDFADLLAEVKINLGKLIKDSNAQITSDFKECPKIRFSKKNLNSIMQNLISNAIKYKSQDQIPEVKIKTSIFENYCLIKVFDNGIGIKEEDKETIFKMFKRLHTDIEGTGVGLFIVKRIVETAGGKVEVESTVGKGSVFKIFLKQ